ncbi:MAG: diguanylate cyclase (GGDEF)-like protein [Oleiphilaceae bacterium]|jgi:diguanylate cyclase (GGDEF)-like protein
MHLEHTMKHEENNDQAIDFNKAKIVSTYRDLQNNISENNDIISRLTRRLQTTLDCSDIIRMFADEIKTVVVFDQMIHEASNQQTIYIGDKAGIHSCQYNLSMDETDLGSLTFSRKKKFLEEELCIIERLAGTLVFPLRNAKLYQLALRAALKDELTDFGNKRALASSLHREAELAIRHNSPLSITMLDVDHFKAINDCFGHIAGDSILKDLAATIKKCARQSDLCFRYGGEEFLLILDNTDEQQAYLVAERIRKAVAEFTYLYNGKIVPVTISLGTATFDQKETLESFQTRADKALYVAKNEGRNIVISSELKQTVTSLASYQIG